MSDRHAELPEDPDLPTEPAVGERSRRIPLHLTPGALGLVAVGGMAGTAARYAMTLLVPAREGWPLPPCRSTCWERSCSGWSSRRWPAVVPIAGLRQRIRLLVGTGFCGAFTTYSALAVEVDLLLRTGQPATAIAYALTTVVVGFLVCTFGIWVAARRGPRAAV